MCNFPIRISAFATGLSSFVCLRARVGAPAVLGAPRGRSHNSHLPPCGHCCFWRGHRKHGRLYPPAGGHSPLLYPCFDSSLELTCLLHPGKRTLCFSNAVGPFLLFPDAAIHFLLHLSLGHLIELLRLVTASDPSPGSTIRPGPPLRAMPEP